MKLFLICFTLIYIINSEAGVTPKRSAATEKYINKYSELAVKHQKNYGIPASITLAQGILESGSGLSRLALASNNHFGIKCHTSWTGGRVYANDDRKHECFRKYKTAEESYEDHSEFLLSGSRYAFLFQLDVNDYLKWAAGLQKAGYATDSRYANTLIKIIEDYELYLFDLAPLPENDKGKTEEKNIEPAPSTPSKKETVTEKRTIYKSKGGLQYVEALLNDNIENIANATGRHAADIRKFNEIPDNYPIHEGDIIYLVKKKNKAEKPNYDHLVQIGESMHSIAQKYGIQIESLYRLNKKDEEYIPTEGDVLKLR
ncbi:MAG: glucosaminidase domain-containing protein [Tannerellaceae bacterium]|jgi:LysM repeat protein|nr:glucosaminidase domain-containing protein [Tannerellaceae bacterium]